MGADQWEALWIFRRGEHDTDCDTNCPSDCKDTKESGANPWFYRFGYRVSITESLEADLFNLWLFGLFSIKLES
jgi:hypothetical protein